MNTRATHEPDVDSASAAAPSDGAEPAEKTLPKAMVDSVATPSRLGALAGAVALVALIAVLVLRRSRRRSNLTNTVMHLPAQVDSLLRRGVEQLSHVAS